MPERTAIHAIVDNYATHKHPKVREWLLRHPHWTFHFTPTSASWLNSVEGFFAKLTRRRLKRGVFRSVVDLHAAINRFVVETNDDDDDQHGGDHGREAFTQRGVGLGRLLDRGRAPVCPQG